MLFSKKSDSWEIISAFTQARCRTLKRIAAIIIANDQGFFPPAGRQF
jgi:hypothetical protein